MRTVYVISQIALVAAVTAITALIFNASPMTWPLALGYGSLLITPLYLSIKNTTKKSYNSLFYMCNCMGNGLLGW